MDEEGRILIFTGDGKGKTTAALGMAVRAHGHGIPVAIIQFVKSDVKTGEFAVLSRLPGVEIFVTGRGFVPPETDPRFRGTPSGGGGRAPHRHGSRLFGTVRPRYPGRGVLRRRPEPDPGGTRPAPPQGKGPRRHRRPDRPGRHRGAHRRRRHGFRDPVRETRVRQRPKGNEGSGVLMPYCPTLVIAGTHSGSGKTSLTLALARALTRRGLRVQTFKTGPDFLDPTYLALASGRPCYNLDGWMAGQDHVRGLFERTAADADCALVEGVMGLFDGADAATDEGSTAEIARWLDAPVLLVVNVHGMGRSIAALVKGFTSFAPDLRFAGVDRQPLRLGAPRGMARRLAQSRGSAAAHRGDPAGGVPRARPPPPRPRHRRPGRAARDPLRRSRDGTGAPPFHRRALPGLSLRQEVVNHCHAGLDPASRSHRTGLPV